MGWLVTLGILLLLAAVPLGVSVNYDSNGPLVRLVLGPVKLTLFPKAKKKTKEKKKSAAPKTEDTPEAETEKPPQNPQPPAKPKETKSKEEKGGSWTDFLPLVKVALDFLGDFRRKLRVDIFRLKLIMAAEDPCDLAVNYGRAWAAVGGLMPQLERIFVIKKRDVEVECDFAASETLVIARLDLTITLGRLLAAVVKFAVRAMIQFLKIQKKRKGGADA